MFYSLFLRSFSKKNNKKEKEKFTTAYKFHCEKLSMPSLHLHIYLYLIYTYVLCVSIWFSVLSLSHLSYNEVSMDFPT